MLAIFLRIVRSFLFLVSRLILAGLPLMSRLIVPWLTMLLLPAVRLVALLMPWLIFLIMFLTVHTDLLQLETAG